MPVYPIRPNRGSTYGMVGEWDIDMGMLLSDHYWCRWDRSGAVAALSGQRDEIQRRRWMPCSEPNSVLCIRSMLVTRYSIQMATMHIRHAYPYRYLI